MGSTFLGRLCGRDDGQFYDGVDMIHTAWADRPCLRRLRIGDGGVHFFDRKFLGSRLELFTPTRRKVGKFE